jgi:hypothetical protein
VSQKLEIGGRRCLTSITHEELLIRQAQDVKPPFSEATIRKQVESPEKKLLLVALAS